MGEEAGRRAHRLGLPYALHICGRTDRILDDVPASGAAFVSGFAFPKAPPLAGLAALVLSAPVCAALAWAWPNVAYLHPMLATLAILLAAMALITVVHPLADPRRRRRGGEGGGTTPGAAGRGLDWTLDQSCR